MPRTGDSVKHCWSTQVNGTVSCVVLSVIPSQQVEVEEIG